MVLSDEKAHEKLRENQILMRELETERWRILNEEEKLEERKKEYRDLFPVSNVGIEETINSLEKKRGKILKSG